MSDQQGQMLNGVPVEGLKDWLQSNPDDPRASALRQKLVGIGVTGLPDAPPTTTLGQAADYYRAFQQGVVLDPIEKVGQIAEHMPGAVGRGARAVGSAAWGALDPVFGLQRNLESAQRHPWMRTAGNIAPWLLIPGVGEDVVASTAIGAGAGATQPLDPKDPNYARDLAYQTGVSGLTAGILGPLGAKATATSEAARASQAAQEMSAAVNRFLQQTPERATMGMYEKIANVAGDRSLIPTEITPSTAAEFTKKVGSKLGALYNQLTFNPAEPGWAKAFNDIKNNTSNTLLDPKMRSDWESAFIDKTGKPIFLADPNNPAAPITGDKLNQLMSHLSDVANDFGRRATLGAGRQYQLMAEGIRAVTKSIQKQFEAQNPTLAAQRLALNEAYGLSKGMVKGTSATVGGISPPSRLAGSIEKKVGKEQYAKPKYDEVRNYLEEQRVLHEGRPGEPPKVIAQPPTKMRATPGERLASDIGHGATHVMAFEAARALGIPWWQAAPLTVPLVSAIAGRGGLTGRAAENLGRTFATPAGVRIGGPGVPAAIQGRAAGAVLPSLFPDFEETR